MPSASVRTATTATPRIRSSVLTAYRRSRANVFMTWIFRLTAAPTSPFWASSRSLSRELEQCKEGALLILQDCESTRLRDVLRPDHGARAQLFRLHGARVAIGDLEVRHPVRRHGGRHVCGHGQHADARLPLQLELRIFHHGAWRRMLRGPPKEAGVERLSRFRVAGRELAPAERPRLVENLRPDVCLGLPQAENRARRILED